LQLEVTVFPLCSIYLDSVSTKLAREGTALEIEDGQALRRPGLRRKHHLVKEREVS
jgi:hypothetical protein